MLFFSGRPHNIVPTLGTQDHTFSQRVSHSCLTIGCLAFIVGLILIVIGFISNKTDAIFIGIGVISLGIVCFVVTCFCLYAKLGIRYNNWAYRGGARVVPQVIETPRQPATTNTRSILPNIDTSIVMISSKTIRQSNALPSPSTGFDVDRTMISTSNRIGVTTFLTTQYA